MKVVYNDGGYDEEIQCDKIKEAENGIHVLRDNPTEKIGYVPYDALKIVLPDDDE